MARIVVSVLIPRLLPAARIVVYRPAFSRREEKQIGAVYTRGLAGLRGADAGAFGGKSANLGELLAAGIPVPPGFALSADAYRAFVTETGLDGAITAALARARPDDVDALTAASKAIDEAMRFAPLSDVVRAEVAEGYAELAQATGEAEPPVAVRSSALGEDSAEASHAGQQESFLWVRGVEHVCDAVRDCWASLFTPQAISYRTALGSEGSDVAMGVTVQAMVDAEISGVFFTCNPVSGDRSMVAVNASWGLGIGVVGGDVTPDDYLVSKITGEVVRRRVSTKHVEYAPDPAGRGTVRLDVAAERRDGPCLGEEALAALVDVARRIERHYGTHQDVEWAIARSRSLPEALLVLQARPVTTRPESEPMQSASALSLVLGTFGAPGDAEPRV
jgi:phosphoenolpyruvate synthase/pyruvate phosphate dikinase